MAARNQLESAARRRGALGARGADHVRRAPLGAAPPLSLLDPAAADASRARAQPGLVDPRATRRSRDDERVAALARRARFFGVSRGWLSGEIADAATPGRSRRARGAIRRRSLADRFH